MEKFTERSVVSLKESPARSFRDRGITFERKRVFKLRFGLSDLTCRNFIGCADLQVNVCYPKPRIFANFEWHSRPRQNLTSHFNRLHKCQTGESGRRSLKFWF